MCLDILLKFDLTTVTGARSALDDLQPIMDLVSSYRGIIGASMSRIQFSLQTSAAFAEANEAAYARITDADIAADAAELLRTRIVQDAATSVLASINQSASMVLKLLR